MTNFTSKLFALASVVWMVVPFFVAENLMQVALFLLLSNSCYIASRLVGLPNEMRKIRDSLKTQEKGSQVTLPIQDLGDRDRLPGKSYSIGHELPSFSAKRWWLSRRDASNEKLPEITLNDCASALGPLGGS